MSLTNKITLVVLAAILIPSLFIFLIFYYYDSSSRIGRNISHLQEIAQVQKSHIASAGASAAVLREVAENYAFLANTGEVMVFSYEYGEISLVNPPRFAKEINKADLERMAKEVRLAGANRKIWEEFIDYRGHVTAAIAEPIEEFHLLLLVKKDISEIRAPLTDTINIFLLTFFIISILGIFIGLNVGKSLADPLRRLSFTIAQFTKNPYGGIKSSIASKDETGSIAKNFNEMAAKLNELYTTLEKKVADRTADLQAKTQEAQHSKQAAVEALEDLKVQEKKLIQEKAKDEAMLSSIGDGLVATDIKGNIILVNKAFENMLGWKEPEVRDKLISKVIIATDEQGGVIPDSKRLISKILKEISKPTTTTTTTTTTIYYKKKSGVSFPVIVTVAPIVIKDEVIGAVEVFRDITQEKEIDKAKTEFVSLASHQLRTPLSTINWYAEMLLAGDAGKLKKEQKKYLDEIYIGNQRMVELVNALLNVSRLELGTFVVEPEATDIVQLAKKAVEDEDANIFKRKIGITEHYDDTIEKLQVDPKLLHMVFQNLISNAIKYTPEKGTVDFSIKKEKDHILVSVADTGYGIPKNQQDKIFTKLFRADNVRAKDTEGTGLGLYIVKAIIEHSGGNIWFESEENKGTTFYITLPLEGMKKREGTKALS